MSDEHERLDGEVETALDDDERRERIRNRSILGAIFVAGCGVALWVGASINTSQTGEAKAKVSASAAKGEADQAQAEKYTLAQQVAAACAADTLDPDMASQLCDDAKQITLEGPQGAQGIPGTQGDQGPRGPQGPQGLTGKAGKNGKDGASGSDGALGPVGPAGVAGPAGPPGKDGATGAVGPPGKDGKDGQDGAVGPAGAAGKDGQPPASWVVYDESGAEIERCQRTSDFDPATPTYSCSRTTPAPTQ